jgi:hypothetical protein
MVKRVKHATWPPCPGDRLRRRRQGPEPAALATERIRNKTTARTCTSSSSTVTATKGASPRRRWPSRSSTGSATTAAPAAPSSPPAQQSAALRRARSTNRMCSPRSTPVSPWTGRSCPAALPCPPLAGDATPDEGRCLLIIARRSDAKCAGTRTRRAARSGSVSEAGRLLRNDSEAISPRCPSSTERGQHQVSTGGSTAPPTHPIRARTCGFS